MKISDAEHLEVHLFNEHGVHSKSISDFEFTGKFRIHSDGVCFFEIVYEKVTPYSFPIEKTKYINLFWRFKIPYTGYDIITKEDRHKIYVLVEDKNFHFVYKGQCGK